MAVRRLWEAAATGKLSIGNVPRELRTEQWIQLLQWLIKHMDQAAFEQWEWQGHMQAGVDTGLDVVQAVREATEEAPQQADGLVNLKTMTWKQFVTALLGDRAPVEIPEPGERRAIPDVITDERFTPQITHDYSPST